MKGVELLKVLKIQQRDYNQLRTNYKQVQQENAFLQKAVGSPLFPPFLAIE